MLSLINILEDNKDVLTGLVLLVVPTILEILDILDTIQLIKLLIKIPFKIVCFIIKHPILDALAIAIVYFYFF